MSTLKKLEKDIHDKVEAEMIKKNNQPPRFELIFQKHKILFAHQKEMIIYLNAQILFINMIVCFHLVAFLMNEYFTREWQKNVCDITREVVDAMID